MDTTAGIWSYKVNERIQLMSYSTLGNLAEAISDNTLYSIRHALPALDNLRIQSDVLHLVFATLPILATKALSIV